MEAWVNGVSTRAVDDLVAALGIGSGISKSEVQPDLRRAGRAGRSVPGPAAAPHRVPVRVPGRHLPARPPHRTRRHGRGGQVTSMAVVVATAVTADGGREILGLDVGDSEDEVFWRGFLRTLKRPRPARGPAGHLRPTRRPRRRSGPCVPRRRAPTLPGPLRPQPARVGAEVTQGHGRRGVPDRVRPTRRRRRSPSAGTRSATSSPPVSPRSDR